MCSVNLLQIDVLINKVTQQNIKEMLPDILSILNNGGRSIWVRAFSTLLSLPYGEKEKGKYQLLSEMFSICITKPIVESILSTALLQCNFQCDISKFSYLFLTLFHFLKMILFIISWEIPQFTPQISSSTHPNIIYSPHWSNHITTKLQLKKQYPPFTQYYKETNQFPNHPPLTTKEAIEELPLLLQLRPNAKTLAHYLKNIDWNVFFSSVSFPFNFDAHYVLGLLTKLDLDSIPFHFLNSFLLTLLTCNDHICHLFFNTQNPPVSSLNALFTSSSFHFSLYNNAKNYAAEDLLNATLLSFIPNFPDIPIVTASIGNTSFLPHLFESSTPFHHFISSPISSPQFLLKLFESSTIPQSIISTLPKYIAHAIKPTPQLLTKFYDSPQFTLLIACYMNSDILNTYAQTLSHDVISSLLSTYTTSIPPNAYDILNNITHPTPQPHNLLDEYINNTTSLSDFIYQFKLELSILPPTPSILYTLQYFEESITTSPKPNSVPTAEVLGSLINEHVFNAPILAHFLRIIAVGIFNPSFPSFLPSLYALKHFKERLCLWPSYAAVLSEADHLRTIDPQLFSFILAAASLPKMSMAFSLTLVVPYTVLHHPQIKFIHEVVSSYNNSVNLKTTESTDKGIGIERIDKLDKSKNKVANEMARFIIGITARGEIQKELSKGADLDKQIVYCVEALQQSGRGWVGIVNYEGIGQWLGLLTLKQNKIIRTTTLSIRDFIIKGLNSHNIEQRALFLVGFLKGIRGSIFTPQNPWIRPLLALLNSFYQYSIPSLTTPISSLFTSLSINHSSFPLSSNASLISRSLSSDSQSFLFFPASTSRYVTFLPPSPFPTKLLLTIANAAIDDSLSLKRSTIQCYQRSIIGFQEHDSPMLTPQLQSSKKLIFVYNVISMVRLLVNSNYSTLSHLYISSFHKIIWDILPKIWSENHKTSFLSFTSTTFNALRQHENLVAAVFVKEFASSLYLSLLNENVIPDDTTTLNDSFDDTDEDDLNIIKLQLSTYGNLSVATKENDWTTCLYDTLQDHILQDFFNNLCKHPSKTLFFVLQTFFKNHNSSLYSTMLSSLINSLPEITPVASKILTDLIVSLCTTPTITYTITSNYFTNCFKQLPPIYIFTDFFTACLSNHLLSQCIHPSLQVLYHNTPLQNPLFIPSFISTITSPQLLTVIFPKSPSIPLYTTLLISALTFIADLQHPIPPLIKIYSSIYQLLVILRHDFPGYLYQHFRPFCDVLPLHCSALRSVILSSSNEPIDYQSPPLTFPSSVILPLDQYFNGQRSLVEILTVFDVNVVGKINVNDAVSYLGIKAVSESQHSQPVEFLLQSILLKLHVKQLQIVLFSGLLSPFNPTALMTLLHTILQTNKLRVMLSERYPSIFSFLIKKASM
ncbi:CCR4-NOT transcription complex subunit 1 CAF1-binding domain-containing protein [Entamoeba marina]